VWLATQDATRRDGLSVRRLLGVKAATFRYRAPAAVPPHGDQAPQRCVGRSCVVPFLMALSRYTPWSCHRAAKATAEESKLSSGDATETRY